MIFVRIVLILVILALLYLLFNYCIGLSKFHKYVKYCNKNNLDWEDEINLIEYQIERDEDK